MSADPSPVADYYCPTCEQSFGVDDRCPNDGTKLVRLSSRIDPLIGRDLDGRYTIGEKIGQGGMGAVYRASQHGLGREVAIKVVSSHLVAEPDVIKRFLREAKLASKLSHPNAVSVLDFGQTSDGVFYLVMELVTGRTLEVVLEAETRLTPDRVVRIGEQVCDALEGAHALSIVHRDLKPSNIMVLDKGRDLVKVLDFGLAKSLAPDRTASTMTHAGELLGTPAFMAPEVALGEQCDGRSDLYSLGCVLYQLGSGRLPFEAESRHELIAMHGMEPAPPMMGVPKPLAKVIDRMLAKQPADRYQTAAENRDALSVAVTRTTPMPFAATSSSAGMDTPTSTWAEAPPPRRRGRGVVIAAVTVALAGGGGAVWWTQRASDPVSALPSNLLPAAPVATPEPEAAPEPAPTAPEPKAPEAPPTPAVTAFEPPDPPPPSPTRPAINNKPKPKPVTHAMPRTVSRRDLVPAPAAPTPPPPPAPAAGSDEQPHGKLPF